MSKKRSWFSLIKRLLFPETNHHHQQQKQKIKRRRWMFGKLLKRTKTLPSIRSTSPTQSYGLKKTEELEEEGKAKKCDQLNSCEEEVNVEKLEESSTNEVKISPSNDDENQNYVEIFAAIKIQTIYRGYLARKALRALKGFVRMQAIIRGRAVRRQAMTTLKCLQSIAKIQSEVCAKRRCQLIRSNDGELHLQLQDIQFHTPKVQVYRQRRKDNELLTKEEQINIILKKKEEILRSKRAKAYSLNHRHSADSEDGISQGRLRYWLEQYINEENSKHDTKNGGKQRFKHIDDLNIFDIATNLPRRSYHKHKKQNSYGEDNSLNLSSPITLPTYMASTESTKAKTRSLNNSPRLRPLHIDAYSDNDSPYKHKVSPMSSINSEATCSGFSKVSNKSSSTFSSFQQKSPSLKGISGPIRSNKSMK